MKNFYLSLFLFIYFLGFSQNNPCFPTEYFAYLPVSIQNTNTLEINENYPEIVLVSSQSSLRFDYTITVSENFEISLYNNSGYTDSLTEYNVNRISCYVRTKSGLTNGNYTGTLSINYNNSTTPCVIALSTQITLSNSNFEDSKFKIFPNPTSDILNFSEPLDISLFNMQGLKVVDYNQVNSINISQLPSGVYILNSKKIGNHKIIKK